MDVGISNYVYGYNSMSMYDVYLVAEASVKV